MRHRIERDSLGDVRVPADAYWGAQTQRAIENFPISGQRMPRRFIQALGIVKRACAFTNEELGLLPVDVAEWVGVAAQEVADGEWDAQFPVDVFQTGSGTSTNMNANEVIANRAIELMGGEIGTRPLAAEKIGPSVGKNPIEPVQFSLQHRPRLSTLL